MNFASHLLCLICRRGTTSVFILVALVLGLAACSQSSKVASPAQADSSQTHFETSLTFNQVTLEQTNGQGRPVWNVKAKQANYSQDRKVAQLQSPTGELFQDGKLVYQFTATKGEIQQDGKKLFLKGNVVVTDPKNGVVLRGNELEWRPNEDLLIVRNQLTVTHRQMQVTAQEAQVFSRAARMELLRQVVAIATDPHLQMQTEHLIWQIRDQKLIGDRPIEIDRFKGQVATDRATANQAEVELKTKIVTLKQDAQLFLLDPPLQVASNHLSWNLNAETVTSNQPLRALERQQQVTVTANQGWMDLHKRVVYLTGNVYSVGQRGQSLNSARLTWYLPTHLFEADGNVVYHQTQPAASFTGQKAIGRLQAQDIVVSGGGVVTQFIP